MIIEKTIQRNGIDFVYRLAASEKLDAMWDDLSDQAKYEICENDLWFNDDLFDRTPEEVNDFLENVWRDDDV